MTEIFYLTQRGERPRGVRANFCKILLCSVVLAAASAALGTYQAKLSAC
jgi:hypothetical protein